MDLLYKSDYDCANAYIDVESEYYLVRLQKKVSEKDYKGAYFAILESCKTNKYKKLIVSIVDDEKQPLSVPFVARSWFASYFSPRFYKLAGKEANIAVVQPQTKFQNNMIHVIMGVIENTNTKVHTEYFENEEEAKEWIKNTILA